MMIAMLLAQLAVPAAAPQSLPAMATACTGKVGEPVAISARPLPVEEIGGRYEPGKGWPSPGDARVGALRYDWGMMLRSGDPRFTDFDLSPGAVHSRRSHCWFAWDSDYAGGNVVRVRNGRIGTSGYRDGYVPPQPRTTPAIPGFRFVAATPIRSDAWIGVWNAEGKGARSRIVAFGDGGQTLLATLPLRLGAIASLPDLHSDSQHLTVMGEGRPGEESAWMRLIWSGERAAR